MSTIYGVRQETLEAYVAAERKKVYEQIAAFWETDPPYKELDLNFPMEDYRKWGNVFAAWCRQQRSE